MEEEEDNHLSHFDLKQKEILSVQTTKLLLQKTEALSLNISGLHESLRHGPLLEPLRADVLSQGRLKESNDSTGSKAGDEGRGATGKRWTSFTKAAVSPKREEEVRRTDRRTKISTFGEESKLLSNSTTSFSRLHGYARYKKNLKNRVEALLNKITERHVRALNDHGHIYPLVSIVFRSQGLLKHSSQAKPMQRTYPTKLFAKLI